MSETSRRQRIHDFFEKPQTWPAWLVQCVILLLIVGSVVSVVIETAWADMYEAYRPVFKVFNYVVLGVFTVEYLVRLLTAPSRWRFAFKPLSVVDFLAVFPNYLEFVVDFTINTTALRGVRLVRVLRFARMLRFSRALRVLRFARYGMLFKKVLRFRNTIFEAITPVLVLFAAVKGVIWVLEHFGFWIQDANLGELFAIVGFALGIILSQKIGVSNDKFIQVEEAAVRLYGTLHSLSLILEGTTPGGGAEACREWAQTFLRHLEDPGSSNLAIHRANDRLYGVIKQAEDGPAELAVTHGDICRDAAFCLSKRARLTPKAYDTLLHQSTMLYLLLTAVFMPGLTGMVSVLLATYILYGMYQLTQDFDSILRGDFNLISIDISELRDFARGVHGA